MSALNQRVQDIVRWPFSSRLAAPLWLALRVYLGSVWLQFGVAKIRGGWLAGDAMHGMLDAVARGLTPAPFPAYRHVAQALLDAGADRWLSVGLPLVELAVSLAFFSGLLLVPAAVGACMLNLNLILSGIASWQFDGRIIALQLLLVFAWRVADYAGVARIVSFVRRLRRGSGPLPGPV
jgi:thiosulfate dehydrogenase [quinone] large subunit